MQAKTLLAVFTIVISIGFVAANSIISQASAQQVVCKGGEVHNGGCPPGLNAASPPPPPTQASNPVTPPTQASNPVTPPTQASNPVTPPTQASNRVTPPTQASTAADPFGPGGRCANGGAECGVCVSC